jgi:hypothetical protein
MKGWVYEDSHQVKKHGAEKASWSVGWIDPEGKRRCQSCGAGKAREDTEQDRGPRCGWKGELEWGQRVDRRRAVERPARSMGPPTPTLRRAGRPGPRVGECPPRIPPNRTPPRPSR